MTGAVTDGVRDAAKGALRHEAATARTVTLLGSTGSIGRQAVQIVDRHRDRFVVRGISAAGSDVRLLARQALDLEVEAVAVADSSARAELVQMLRQGAGGRRLPEVVAGPEAATQLAGTGSDVVLNGITGSIGLRPTLAALAAGSTLALANKESLIVGGSLVKQAAAPGQIVPVDSEHSAIAQALRSGSSREVQRLVLTASGGPFRGMSRDQLTRVTPAQALQHPNFAMGRVVTTNSATLVNKGLEVIEAHLLFDVPFERIDVVVHPEQQVHSMVQFRDGSTIAQAGPPRMLVPIALGLSWPDRLDGVDEACDWSVPSTWHFEPLDDQAFPAVRLARQAGVAGGTYPAVYNASNEVCVDAFHDGVLGFTQIVDTVARVVEEHEDQHGDQHGGNQSGALTVEDVLRADDWARGCAREIIGLGPKEARTL